MRSILLSILCLATAASADLDNSFWTLRLEGFFPGEARGMPKRLNVYLIRRDGQWITALGTPTIDGKAVWNTALMIVDPGGAVVEDRKLTGTLRVTLVPDPWVPADQEVRVATVTLDAAITDTNSLAGTWQLTIPGEAAELDAARLRSPADGKLTGALGDVPAHDIGDASYDLALYNLVPGRTEENFQRRRALSFGVSAGRIISARLGQMDIRHNAYDYEFIPTPAASEVTPDTLAATVSFRTDTLEGEPAEFALRLSGRRLADWTAGTWTGTVAVAGRTQSIGGFFRGNIRKGATPADSTAADDRPWFMPVQNFRPVAPGEHPRLFFRQARLIGSTMGSPEEFAAMLRFVAEYRIEPAIDRVFSLDQAVAAHQRLLAAEQLGKLVLQHD